MLKTRQVICTPLECRRFFWVHDVTIEGNLSVQRLSGMPWSSPQLPSKHWNSTRAVHWNFGRSQRTADGKFDRVAYVPYWGLP
jgi:hypothetical protein